MSAGVTVSGHFPPGTKVELFRRTGGSGFERALLGSPVDETTVDDAGDATFDGLQEGDRVFIAAELDEGWRGVAATAKPAAEVKQRLSGDEIRARLIQTQPAQEPQAVVEGARSTATARPLTAGGQPFGHPQTGLPTPEDQLEEQPAPYARQEDAEGPQRSSTITGQATPCDPDEIQPKMRQDQLPEGTPQASATELGEATPVDVEEEPEESEPEDQPEEAEAEPDEDEDA